MPLTRWLCLQISAVFVVLAAMAPRGAAQSGIGNTTSTPVAGVPHDYITGLNEIVNPANGQLSIRIPQPVPPERGQNWPSYAFLYDSGAGFNLQPQWSVAPSNPNNNPPVTYLSALQYGPSFSNGPGTVWFGSNNLSVCQQTSNYSCTTYTCTVRAGYLFEDPDGGLHGLGLQVGIPVTTNTSNDCNFFNVSSYYTGGDERYKATMDLSTLAVTVVDLHGNQPTVEDVNGNYHDTTHRTTSFPARPTFQTQTINGTPPSFSVTGTSQDGTNTCAVTSITPIYYQPGPIATKTLMTLANGQQYIFQYDTTLDLLNKVTYPTGATVTYTWSVIPKSQGVRYYQPTAAAGGNCQMRYDWFAITKRVVSYDGITNAEEQDFSYSTVWPDPNTYKWTSKSTTVTTKDLIRGTSFQTVYNYVPMLPPSESDKPWEDLGYVPVENTVQYFGTDGSLLKTTTKSWATFDIPSAECTTLPSGLTSGQFYTYQPYPPNLGAIWDPYAQKTDLPTDIAEYDYGQVSSSCAQPGSSVLPVRETQTTYQSFATTPLFGYPALQDRPSTIKIYGVVNGAKTLVAETDYAYDGAAPSPVAPTPYGHDETNFGSGSTAPRGNPTTITRKCFVGSVNCTNSVTNYTYDTTGQVLSVQDANLNTTTYSYADNYTTDDGTPSNNTNLFVTKITQPTTNSVSHVRTFQYGFNDGKLRMVIDENSQPTKYCYWTGGCSGTSFDPFVRLTETDYPDGGKTNIAYNDAAYNPATPSPSVTMSRAMTAATNLTSLVAYDGIGHTVRSVLTSDPDCASGDRTDTTYDGLGRTYTVSNPYCTTSDLTYGLTTYIYDALGRTTQVTHPDNTTILTTYTGRATQVQDEGNGTQRVTRISQTDALGRLLSLCEVAPGPFIGAGGAQTSSLIGSAGTPALCNQDIQGNGFLTSYQYDTLSNLLQVNQTGIAPRTFNYDSLSRLLTASNPESGSISYAYDANGNLSTKTAPAPNQTGSATVTTTYQYDALNRLTQKSYSDGSTPTVSFTYDASNSYNHNLIGRLALAVVPGWTFYYSYEAMGRLANKAIYTPNVGVNHYVYTYDLLGDITSEYAGYGYAYYGYSTADRLTSVTSSYSDANNPANLFSAAQYTAFGGLKSDTLGDGETETYIYVPHLTRLQSYTASLNTTTLYNFNITSFAPNGDVMAATDTANGNWTYTYDPFNRLVGSNKNSGQSIFSYVYDRFGNRWQQNGPNSFLATFTGNNPGAPQNNNRMDGYSYDAAGNLLNDGVHNYTYDAENRMIQVDAGNTATYVYDPDGRRVMETTTVGIYSDPAGTFDFFYDQSGRMLFKQVAGSTAYLAHVYAGSRHLAVQGGGTYFQHSDWLGTERFQTVYEFANNPWYYTNCASLPFGDALHCQNEGGNNGDGTSGNLHFTGKERDSATGLDNFGARYDSSSMGRFMSPDAFFKDSHVGDPQSWNEYAYARNNPLRYIDPNGQTATVHTSCIRMEAGQENCNVTISATIAIYAAPGSGLTQEQLNGAATTIQNSIQNAWSGSFTQDGTTYNVSTQVSVQVAASEGDASKTGAQNVIGLSNGPADAAHDLNAFTGSSNSLGTFLRGQDTGIWNYNTLGADSRNTAAHEFAHLLGIGDKEGHVLSNTDPSGRPIHATPSDLGWGIREATGSVNLALSMKSWYTGPTLPNPFRFSSTDTVGAPWGSWWK